uniref:uncharacterized protein isoform X1 n=1 Tax=Pristiophorus japonicus TaxID=55135 RepID=UPI00398E5C03
MGAPRYFSVRDVKCDHDDVRSHQTGLELDCQLRVGSVSCQPAVGRHWAPSQGRGVHLSPELDREFDGNMLGGLESELGIEGPSSCRLITRIAKWESKSVKMTIRNELQISTAARKSGASVTVSSCLPISATSTPCLKAAHICYRSLLREPSNPIDRSVPRVASPTLPSWSDRGHFDCRFFSSWCSRCLLTLLQLNLETQGIWKILLQTWTRR